MAESKGSAIHVYTHIFIIVFEFAHINMNIHKNVNIHMYGHRYKSIDASIPTWMFAPQAINT